MQHNGRLDITNKRILKFYENNPGIDFQSVNLIFIDLFEKLLLNGTEAVVHNQLLESISEIKREVGALKDKNGEMLAQTLVRFVEVKNEYMADFQKIMQTNTHDQIAPLLEKNNCFLMEKTTNLIREILPQTNSQIMDTLTSFSTTIHNDTKQLANSSDQQSIKDFITNFELKSTMMMQPVYSYISASEERTNTNIKDGQSKLMSEMSEALAKFTENQHSQQNNDKKLSAVLTKIYSSSEVQTKQPDGLIVLRRQGRPNILIENHDIETNVTVEEVQSFTLSVDDHNCNGIFISQQSGISTKKNYHIEIHNNNILVYVHTAQYEPSRIEAAVDIIDQLSNKIRQFKHSGGDDCTVPKDIMDSINNEYQLFISQKNAVFEVFKESQKKVLAQVDEIRFPALDKFLATKYSAPIQKPGLKCDLCKSFSANNLKALAAHKRGCIRKLGKPVSTMIPAPITPIATSA